MSIPAPLTRSETNVPPSSPLDAEAEITAERINYWNGDMCVNQSNTISVRPEFPGYVWVPLFGIRNGNTGDKQELGMMVHSVEEQTLEDETFSFEHGSNPVATLLQFSFGRALTTPTLKVVFGPAYVVVKKTAADGTVKYLAPYDILGIRNHVREAAQQIRALGLQI